jgi:hypothetical protein
MEPCITCHPIGVIHSEHQEEVTDSNAQVRDLRDYPSEPRTLNCP